MCFYMDGTNHMDDGDGEDKALTDDSGKRDDYTVCLSESCCLPQKPLLREIEREEDVGIRALDLPPTNLERCESNHYAPRSRPDT